MSDPHSEMRAWYEALPEDARGRRDVLGVDVYLAIYRNPRPIELGDFRARYGRGRDALAELCKRADQYQETLTLTVEPYSTPERPQEWVASQLESWYATFGFKTTVAPVMVRIPTKGV